MAFGDGLGGVAHRVQRIGDVSYLLVEARHFRDAAGVVGDGPISVQRDDHAGHGQHGGGRDRDAVQPFEPVGCPDTEADGDHRQSAGFHGDAEAGDDVGRVASLRGRCDMLHRTILGRRVVLGDHDHGRGEREAHERAEPHAHGMLAHDLLRHEIKQGGRDHARHDHALVERIHDLAAFARLDEERADDGGEDGDGAEDQGEQHRRRAEEQAAEQHGRDQRDRVGLEQIRRHAGAVADVVADVIRDHRGIARIVLGDARLDLADEIGADVSALGEDTAAQAREDGDQGAAEGEAHEGPQRILGVAQQAAHDEVVAGHSEDTQADHQHAGDGPAAERDLKGGVDAVVGGLRGAHVRAHRDVHADVSG